VRGIGAVGVVIAFGTTACAVPFADTDFAPYRGDGAATLEGRAYLDVGTNDPKFVTCLEQPVYLAPDTVFDSHVLNTHRGLRGIVSGASLAAPYWRQSICDSRGRFTFSRIPSGDWFAVTQVRCPRTLIYDEGRETLVKKVSLRPWPKRCPNEFESAIRRRG